MAIIKEKIIKKTPLKNISNKDEYLDFKKSEQLKKDKTLQASKTKELINIKEEERLEKIVLPHLDKLYKQLFEKNTLDFWAFPDRSGFKKIVNISFDEMQNLLKSDIKKYADRKICLFKITFQHMKSKTTIWRESGILLIADISVFHIDKKGMLNGKNPSTGCTFNWHIDSFKLTKLTYKLLETIMYPIAEGIHQCASLGGFPVNKVIKDLEKKGVDFTDVLSPLAGC